MRMNGNKWLAVLLIVLGAMIIFDKAGFLFGHFIKSLVGFLFPVALIFLGYIGIRNGRTFFGWCFAILGGVILLGKLSWLISLLFAAALIIYGINLLRKKAV